MKQWVIYYNPSDFPGKYVMRCLTINFGQIIFDEDCKVEDNYNAIKKHLPNDVSCIKPDQFDDSVIMEIWI